MKRAPSVCTLVLTLFFIHKNLAGQCYSTSWQEGTSFSEDNSIGVYDISLPGNAQLSDNVRASASALLGILTNNTHYLVVRGFNFSVPSYASICGVTVQMECRATGLLLTAAVRDNDIRIVKNNVISGSNRSLGSDWGSGDAYRTYGGASDLWGTTLTPADVNNANFGVAISARIIALISVLPDAEIDHVRMRIDMNPILPVKLAYFRALKKGDVSELEWKTTEEEPGAKIHLQRKISNGNWEVLKTYSLTGFSGNNVYKAYDTVTTGGVHQYRLQTVLPGGSIDYSSIQTLDFADRVRLAAWPNPATNKLTVSMTDIQVRDINGRRLTLPVQTANGSSTITISSLAPGIYLASDGKNTVRFIKE